MCCYTLLETIKYVKRAFSDLRDSLGTMIITHKAGHSIALHWTDVYDTVMNCFVHWNAVKRERCGGHLRVEQWFAHKLTLQLMALLNLFHSLLFQQSLDRVAKCYRSCRSICMKEVVFVDETKAAAFKWSIERTKYWMHQTFIYQWKAWNMHQQIITQ